MSGDDNYGYQPPQLPYEVSQYDDYVTNQDYVDVDPVKWPDVHDDYTLTQMDLSNVDINKIWQWVQYESDEKTRAQADTWTRIATLLDATRANLRRHADALAPKFTGEAGPVFLQHVGAALYSLTEWH